MKLSPAVFAALQGRRQRTVQKRRQIARAKRRLAFALAWLVSSLGLLALIVFALLYTSITHDLPPVEAIPAYLDQQNGLLRHPTLLYDRSGTHLLAALAPSEDERPFLALAEFSPLLVKATLALEQPDFWDSPGYRLSSWHNPDAHPTLAQRLAFTFLLAEEPPTLRRALRERLLAAQLTARYGRSQILEWYLNSADYGQLAYGAETAARFYLGKSARDLTLSEAALLAGLAHTPGINPWADPESAKAARLEALRALFFLGWISPEEARQAAHAPLALAAPSSSPRLVDSSVAPAFVDYALAQIRHAPGGEVAARGGLIIHTSLEYALQQQAACLLQTQLAQLRGIALSPSSACPAAALLPPIETSGTDPIGGVLLLDPDRGEILAASGVLTPQAAGWSVSPFLYLTAFVRGLNPASLTWDLPEGAPALGQTYHGPMRLRTALLSDAHIPARTLLRQMGSESVRQTALSFGLDLPSTGLLEQDFLLSPFSLAAAYSVFANEGVQVGISGAGEALEPLAILQVLQPDGTLWKNWPQLRSRAVVSPQLAYLMNHILQESHEAASLERPAAARSAFTLDERGVWTVGYTPQRVALVFLGEAGPAARRAAQELWSALLEYASYGLERSEWSLPPGVVRVRVCDPSGLLPTPACPRVVEEVFLEGRQPVEYDTLFQTYEINLETGLLATVFTPPELVRRRVYLALPPQALEWAQQAGLELPPSTFDAYQPSPASPEVNLTAPAMFAQARGTVEVRGTASGANFVSYRLEYGAGPNPKTWWLLDERKAPVVNGLLGRWDTTGLNGLYTLRLLVLRTENRLEQAFVILTLDNTPPQVEIVYPRAGQVLQQKREAEIALQAQVNDPFLTEVNFYLDGVWLGKMTAPPFGLLWTTTPGEHRLRVTALDQAGNLGEAEVRFTVR